MLFPIVPGSVPPVTRFFFSSRSCSRAIFAIATFARPSLYGVPPTTQTDKSNPENGTGDAASSGKKVGPGTYCGKCVARGNPNSDNGLTPVTFEGLKGKERQKEGGKGKRERERRRRYPEHIPAVYCAYREIWRGRVDRMCEGQFSSGAAEGPTRTWVGKKKKRIPSPLSNESGSQAYKYLRRLA